jgi:glutathione S-transferase
MRAADSVPRAPVEIFGRRASLFTRIALLFAETLRVPWQLTHIPDMTNLDTAAYGGSPALKLPVLRVNGAMVLGTENICRALAALAAEHRPVHVVWPEHLPDARFRTAQELVWHCATSQVQLAMGTILSGLPADNIYFVKARTGVANSLAWLDQHVDELLAALPAGRELSLLEASLFCLMEHLVFRPTVPVAPYARLNAFVTTFAQREASRATVYRTEPA